MKRGFSRFFLMGAAALALSTGFAACSDNDNDPASTGNEVSKNVVDKPEVNVDFVFNISTENAGSTRMSPENIQATLSNPFLGVTNAHVMAYTLVADGKTVATAAEASKNYDLGEIMGAGTISSTNSRRVIELSLPEGTNTLMFWGKAIKSLDSNKQGQIILNVEKDITKNSFALGRRIPEGNGDNTSGNYNGEIAFHQYQTVLAAVLTKIVKSSLTISSTTPITFGTETWSGTINWYDYVDVTGTAPSCIISPKTKDPVKTTDDLSPLGEILANAFVTMNTIYTNEVRAGSAPALARLLGDLYNVIISVANATETNIKEKVAKQLASKIRDNISSVINDAGTNPRWETTTSTVVEFSGVAASDATMVTGDLNGFPHTLFNVPQGAAVLKYDVPNRTYSYNNAIPTYAMSGTGTVPFDPVTYRYPAELCYFGNSPIRVTNDEHVTADYPLTTAEWDDDTNTKWNGWDKNGHVLSSTRSVAMQQNINYGTAMLKTTVQYGAATLEDNNAAIQQTRMGATEPNNTFTPSDDLFTLTGVLVGGVEPEVGWNYLTKTTTPTWSTYIYDKDLPSEGIPASGESTPNYTLVWDNWNQSLINQKQNVVYVALEFVNNSGRDFWGMNNLIRAGATFYITGKLDPDVATATTLTALGKTAEEFAVDKSLGVVWPDKYALPPYNADGSTIKQRRIFIQDYMTIAKFTLGATSLQKAIIAVPDLRSTQISLGLSVDLSWRAGLEFAPVLGD